MFGNNFGYNSMPTATQPYGYPMGPMNPYMNNTLAQPQQMQPQQTQTNKIYVNGIEDVRNRNLSANSDYIFLDNDKPLLYQKVVDSKGQFEVKTFDITPHIEQEAKQENTFDLKDYVKLSDLKPIQDDLKELKEKFAKTEIKKVDVLNGISGTGK